MGYGDILANTKATGVQDYDQGTASLAAMVSIKKGVCLALTLQWLLAKKKGTNFWNKQGTPAEPLLASYQQLNSAVELQSAYEKSFTGDIAPDATTSATLQAGGLQYVAADQIWSPTMGFAYYANGVDEAGTIATKILSATSRFFILGIYGATDAHAIGLYRPYALIGKSSDASLFDSNFGEFATSGQSALTGLLYAVNRYGYMAANIDLNKSFVLWGYKD